MLTNIKDISINVKDMSDVATEVSADIIVAKDNITNKLDNAKEIIKIIVDVFGK